jgi:hypothetical protein
MIIIKTGDIFMFKLSIKHNFNDLFNLVVMLQFMYAICLMRVIKCLIYLSISVRSIPI